MPSQDLTVRAPDTKPGDTLAAVPPQKVGFVSLGCPKNLVDSEVMMGLLARGGAELTSSPQEADVIVVNTCSFIESAQQESIDTILEMARHKIEGKAKKLIVAGCLVERYRDQIRKDIPEVDAVVGTGELENILAAAGVGSAQARNDSPFVVLPSRPEGDARASQGRFSRESWDGAIGDLPPGTTAANFGKLTADATSEDKALAIMNMIVEVVSVLSIAAARACGQQDIVLTGKLTRIFRFMQRMKRLNFIFGSGFLIPEHADYATAIGAARAAMQPLAH